MGLFRWLFGGRQAAKEEAWRRWLESTWASDRAFMAAERAMLGGEPQVALENLTGVDPAHARGRLVRAQALAALGRADEARVVTEQIVRAWLVAGSKLPYSIYEIRALLDASNLRGAFGADVERRHAEIQALGPDPEIY